MLRQIIATGCFAILIVGPAFAAEAAITIKKISSDGTGAAHGWIVLKGGHHGLKITPDLRDLPDIAAGTDGWETNAVMGYKLKVPRGRAQHDGAPLWDQRPKKALRRRVAIYLWRHPEIGASGAVPRAAAERSI